MPTTESSLQDIQTKKIVSNPDNPRLIFRENELNDLLDSIKEVGIKVPITVYEKGTKYFLIDGERRWRCSLKLNLETMPAIIQPEPTKLENLLMMFNIHNVRVEWDLMPMALKLKQIKEMLNKEGKPNSNKHLAGITGVSLPTVKRAFDLLELPNKYQRMLLQEAQKPKDQQRVTADLFVEITKSCNVIEKYTPEVYKKVKRKDYVDAMVNKYIGGVVKNVVSFRNVSKIARAERTGVRKSIVVPILVKLASDPLYDIDTAFKHSVEINYQQRDLNTKVVGLLIQLREYRSSKQLSSDLIKSLKSLRKRINELLGNK